ncbi:MAG: glycosyltransferase family 4 protein, partial [Undibacterium sp.]
MKIFFPFQSKDIGGTSIFAKKFQAGMETRGHEVFSEYRPDYDVLFLIVQAPFSYLWDAKRKGKKIVQRLDGVYYWSVAGWRYPIYNLKAFLIRHLFADISIYQSDYSKRSVERFLGKKRGERAITIYNGVDTTLFSVDGPIKNLRAYADQKIVFCASEFRRTDQIMPILSSLEAYRERFGNDIKLVLAGKFHRELDGFETKLQQYPWVQFLGKIPNVDLPQYLRAADVFVFTHLNPPCPNNILEAMACG